MGAGNVHFGLCSSSISVFRAERSLSVGGRVTRQSVPISMRRSVAAYARLSGLNENLPRVKRAFRKVRKELANIGLLSRDEYLGKVEVCISSWPSTTTAGFIFDQGVNWLDARMGYKPGVIYLPLNVPHRAYRPGYTLLDTLRHEFAHAWHWIEPGFFRRSWFIETFGASYVNLNPKPLETWRRRKFQTSGFVRQWERGETDDQQPRERLNINRHDSWGVNNPEQTLFEIRRNTTATRSRSDIRFERAAISTSWFHVSLPRRCLRTAWRKHRTPSR